MDDCSRRNFLYLAGAGALAGAASQGGFKDNRRFLRQCLRTRSTRFEARSPVALVRGEETPEERYPGPACSGQGDSGRRSNGKSTW